MLREVLFIILSVITIHASKDYVAYPEVGKLYKFHEVPRNWSDARDTCIKEGSSLAMPINEAEASLLQEIFNGHPSLDQKNMPLPDFMLLGFHDIFREGEYVTDKGVSIQYYYHKWRKGEPDNEGKNANCGSLHRLGKLSDFPCDCPAVFVCQKTTHDIQESIISNCISQDPAYKYSSRTEKCYKLHLNPKIWAEALAICTAEGGNLATISSEAEEDFLVAMFTRQEDRVNHVPFKNYALLGFHDMFQENRFITIHGEDLESIGYLSWGYNQPDNNNGNENCGAMDIYGDLADMPCNFPAVFFCETESKSQNQLDVRFSRK